MGDSIVNKEGVWRGLSPPGSAGCQPAGAIMMTSIVRWLTVPGWIDAL
jgi:hypothetical protein